MGRLSTNQNRGITLVELSIAMGVSSLLILGISGFSYFSLHTADDLSQRAQFAQLVALVQNIVSSSINCDGNFNGITYGTAPTTIKINNLAIYNNPTQAQSQSVSYGSKVKDILHFNNGETFLGEKLNTLQLTLTPLSNINPGYGTVMGRLDVYANMTNPIVKTASPNPGPSSTPPPLTLHATTYVLLNVNSTALNKNTIVSCYHQPSCTSYTTNCSNGAQNPCIGACVPSTDIAVSGSVQCSGSDVVAFSVPGQAFSPDLTNQWQGGCLHFWHKCPWWAMGSCWPTMTSSAPAAVNYQCCTTNGSTN